MLIAAIREGNSPRPSTRYKGSYKIYKLLYVFKERLDGHHDNPGIDGICHETIQNGRCSVFESKRASASKIATRDDTLTVDNQNQCAAFVSIIRPYMWLLWNP